MSKTAALVRVTGLVQGVGFRPTVYRIAAALNLSGEVFNDEAGVGVRIEGARESVDAFAETLLKEKPPLSRIDSIETTPAEVRGFEGFSISTTHAGGRVTTSITADAATCRACFEDLFTRGNRRWRYAFTNCTHCGPRFTITRRLPYDRPQTSMAVFPMCPDCMKEYEDPLDRRFHAQPNACPVCGPKLLWTDAEGRELPGDPVREAVKALNDGLIVAMKGLGGFHLVCDARNAKAVETLRARKHRREKPLAVMAANLPSLAQWVKLTDSEKEILTSPAHPIVLAEKTEAANALEGVAPDLTELGVMLPYTPLHALLFHTFAGEPEGIEWFEKDVRPELLVMTSANPGGEPLVIKNDEAIARLSGIADRFLMHNREILLRCDDSVVRVLRGIPGTDGEPQDHTVFVRRARGFVPESVPTPADDAHPFQGSVLAFGPWLKNTCALSRGDEIVLSQHIGDLENAPTIAALDEATAHLKSILDVEPTVVACDLHPDFASTQAAEALAAEKGLPLLRIAHHAAHVGVVMAERGACAMAGLALDGVGLGPETAAGSRIWGGECLWVGPTGFTRLGTIRALPLPGGDRAAREPWRMGAAILNALGLPDEISAFFPTEPFASKITALCGNPRLSPATTSLGRWIDGFAALLGLVLRQHDESVAAMRLEAAALRWAADQGESGSMLDSASLARFGWSDVAKTLEAAENSNEAVLDLLPVAERLVAGLRAGEDKGALAAHALATTAELLARFAARRLAAAGLEADQSNRSVALTGGCLVNRILAAKLATVLTELDYEAVLPARVPPGDGGLALGEAWLARLAAARGAEQYGFEDRVPPNVVL